MKRKALFAALAVMTLAGAFAVGAKGTASGPKAMRGAIVAQVLGMDPEAFRAAVRQKGLRALLEEKGMDLKTFREALLKARAERLEAAYAAGKIPKARYELLKRRLEAERARLAAPSLGDLLAKAGTDLAAFKAELKAERKAEIEKLYELGLISSVQKGRMLANLDRWAEAVLKAPAVGPRHHGGKKPGMHPRRGRHGRGGGHGPVPRSP